MKRIFACAFLIPLVPFAQNRISGLGPFRIGETLCSKIPSFADTSRGRLYYARSDDPFTEQWSAGYYQISGMWVENLDLKFYKDTLYFIECKYSDSLGMALKAKYGNGVIKRKQAPIKCRTALKIEYEEQETTFFTTYPTVSKNISAWTTVGKWFNDKCEPEYLSRFNIMDNRIAARINALIKAKELKDHREKEVLMRKKLTNF